MAAVDAVARNTGPARIGRRAAAGLYARGRARWRSLWAYTTGRRAYGHSGRLVVTYHPALWEGQPSSFRHRQLAMEAGNRVPLARRARWYTDLSGMVSEAHAFRRPGTALNPSIFSWRGRRGLC